MEWLLGNGDVFSLFFFFLSQDLPSVVKGEIYLRFRVKILNEQDLLYLFLEELEREFFKIMIPYYSYCL